MTIFDRQQVLRIIVYILALLILLGSLAYSNFLANQLEEKEKANIQLYADAQSWMGRNTSNSDVAGYQFIFENIVKNTDDRIPRMLLGENMEFESSIPDLETEGLDSVEIQQFIENKRKAFEAENPPIKIEYEILVGDESYKQVKYIVFGESNLLKQLRWFPFFQLLVAFAFIGIVFIGFAVAQRSEQNKVWVGLAKETAHQLGTPVSSLMAWVELFKLRSEGDPRNTEMIDEMERDIVRLEKITDRFSKIGSQPDLQPENLKSVLNRSADYLRNRMTRKGNIKLEVVNELPEYSQLWINPSLFDWVIENLLKNALDAIQSKEGSIHLSAGERGNNYYIDIKDTGKGIPKSHFRKVFQPGFTTKKRGWGLGLSLSKRIIEQYHKGKIFVKQSEQGKGTTFRILLPKG